ncbi:hypothetical protein PV327_011342 [Microctonus hyperodae]|uniref:Uncharacterized protein n=1 Tax=Microctonus hyperodae TaxID=165561 RepID=A0AA39ESM4_MICHY|nr:hypothetical protein PV327_011342 [Microctonus hyperodae]
MKNVIERGCNKSLITSFRICNDDLCAAEDAVMTQIINMYRGKYGEFYRYITEVFHENQLGHMDINGEFRRQFQTKQYCPTCATEEEMAKEKYRNVINIRVSDEDINAQYVISLLDNFLYCCNKCKKAVITIEYK